MTAEGPPTPPTPGAPSANEARLHDSQLVTAHLVPEAAGEPPTSRQSQAPLLRFLLSPRAVMVLVPLLALAVGLALAAVGLTNLTASGRAMAEARCLERAASAGRRIEDALGISDPILDRLQSVGAELAVLTPTDTERLARAALSMTELMTARTGVSQAYVALPDGRFFSVTEGGLFHVTDAGTTHDFVVEGEKLRELSRRNSAFDPRTREWYQLAESQQKRAFTGPYTFYSDKHTGVTRFDVVRRADGPGLSAVVAIDFDVERMTQFMSARDSKDAHSVIFTSAREVLVWPNEADAEPGRTASDKTTARSNEGREDPLVKGLFEHMDRHPQVQLEAKRGTSGLFRFEGGGHAYMATVTRLGEPAPDWFIATLSSEDGVLASVYDYRKKSLYVGALALVVAAILGRALGRQILRTRTEAERAKSELARVRKQAHDLGSYRLLSRLGEGGMGEVWRAEHRLLARRAAIKLIRSDRPMTDERREILEERFRREARAIAALRCRNTVEIYDYGLTEDGTVYFVMELLDGIDLETLVHDHGPQPAERVRQILIQVCSSLAEAHDAGLVHRDVKPANIMLCRAADELDVVKVLDFGLVLSAFEQPPESRSAPAIQSEVPGAHENLRLTRGDAQLGTPGYMSPEQVLGSMLDGRADVYALGCVAYRLLSGHMPFDASTALGMMLEQVQTPAPNIAEHSAVPVSSDFAQLITSCLGKAPSERPASARALRDALSALPAETGWGFELAADWWVTHRPERQPSLLVSLPPGPRVDLVGPTSDYPHSPS